MKRIDYLFAPAVEAHAEELIDIPKKLIELLGQSEEEADKILAMVDGVELYQDADAISDRMVVTSDLLLPMVSEEGFADRLQSLWENIKRWLKTLMGVITSDSRQMGATVNVIKYRAENVRVTARARLGAGQTQRNPLVLTSYVAALSTFYRPPKDMGAVNAGLLNLTKVIQAYFEYVDQTLAPGVGSLSRTVRSLDPMTLTPERMDQLIVRPVSSLLPSRLMDRVGRSSKAGADITYGPQLMGNVRLRFQSGNQGTGNLRSFNEQRLTLVFAELNPKPVPPTLELPRFQLTVLDQTVRNITALADLIAKSLSHANARQAQMDELTAAFDQFVNKANAVPNGNPYVKEQADQLLRLSRSLTAWMTDPYRGMVGTATRAMRGALMACELNIK